MIELLSPVGDLDCLKAAVQNGANSVYFGGSLFNARAFASNFDNETLKESIRYAKLRNVKINFTLNTLLKNVELNNAIKLAEYVYSLGCDAVIVQDLGLAKYLIDHFPEMDIHASTQITAHNLQGVLELQNIGFKRVVLSRELSVNDIEYICRNSNVEIETFIHGALCMSYSGQCLFSSMIGARSGNRGKCAQPCRLPYELIEENSNEPLRTVTLDKGYLLSPKDLCGLAYIPKLISAGVKCFKIEGRMKPPEYVATVTKIYRKYIDLAQSDEPYEIDPNDEKLLLQVFNRGGFSKGNLDDEPNTDYVCKDKPNNVGLYIGNVSNYNSNKGLITFKTSETIEIGDTFAFENEEHRYTVSELMNNTDNIKKANNGDIITIGRAKGDIKPGDKIFKLRSASMTKEISQSFNRENIKIPLTCVLKVHKDTPISMDITSQDSENGNYFSMAVHKESDIIPIKAENAPMTRERLIEQVNKTTDTPFYFKNIKVELDENTYVPKISGINSLRRMCLEEMQNAAIRRFERDSDIAELNFTEANSIIKKTTKYSLLLNILDLNFDYSKLVDVHCIYVPLKYFLIKGYQDILKILSAKSDLYIYMPTIIKNNYRNILFNNLDTYISEYSIKGIVFSNISGLEFLKNYVGKLELVSNYTLNIYNSLTINELKELGVTRITLSPELDKKTLISLSNSSNIDTELMVYGKVPLMNMGYCLLGSSNKCYPTCDMKCRENDKKFYLKDRLGYEFRIVPDNMQAVTTLYNSKTNSILFNDININNALISILDENINEINNIVISVQSGIPISGSEYTSGNLNRFV